MRFAPFDSMLVERTGPQYGEAPYPVDSAAAYARGRFPLLSTFARYRN